MRDLFIGSLLAVTVTGALLLSEAYTSGDAVPQGMQPRLSYFVPFAGFAFLMNLVLAGVLFERAVSYSRPAHWMAVRRRVNETDVREAVKAFVGRAHRASIARESNESDLSVLLPDQGEGSADDAIRALLDDARRAMSERRHEELRRSLNSIRELISFAMDEIKAAGIRWSAPGAQPHWPPLRELGANLYSFREDVIRQGDREYIQELLRFDYTLTRDGVRERCGELFTVGLDGYRWNYQIVNRIGGTDLREQIRDRFSLNALAFTFDANLEDKFPYARELVRQQARLLSNAMESNQPSDYDRLHQTFQALLSTMRFDWEEDNWLDPNSPGFYQQVQQEYRIALMGLGGRALALAQENKLEDANEYLNVGRLAYGNLRLLSDDFALAFMHSNSARFPLWEEWETEGALSHQPIHVSAERYPLLFFTLRLMELSSDVDSTIDLNSRAQRALDWFLSNAESVEPFMQTEAEPTAVRRRELATESLRFAVRRDEITEDYEIIARDLSETRIAAFTADVYSAASSSNSIERLFEQAGASLHVSGDDADAPEERILSRVVHKGFLTDSPADSHSSFLPLDGGQWGESISDDAEMRFCELLEGAPKVELRLQTPLALVGGIDQALEALGYPQQVVVVLAGNWSDLQSWLNMGHLAEFQPDRGLLESQRTGGLGRYRGHPVLSTPAYNGQCIYVVDLAGWGQFLRAHIDGGRDIRVDVNPIPADRAQELLAVNPTLFANEPDDGSKLRKLQASAEVIVGARTGFRVTDPSRARRIAPMSQDDSDDELSGD